MSAREDILNRMRRSLEGAGEAAEAPREYRRALAGDTEVVELLIDRLVDYKAQVHHGIESIADILDEGQPVVVPADLPQEWRVGEAIFIEDDPLDPEPMDADDLDAMDAVLTGCAAAVAVSGTIMLDTGAAQGRRAITLVPDHHVIVVRRDQIVGHLAEALPRLSATSPQTWISGPSATSDIELQRVEGVHGPRRLDVVILDD
ncbi:LutC/YkgG family protein [Glycomyces buryatensis]|uniref:Lactate utilization protein C n=1 Tax=Glycomyces buryatensis TaxID=2570927 RepID=A0A4S8Q908_9ACTN|nr:LUD domain-containing protein [Glycomyces buryatensis]THV40680.1 lactate utilization protein C [Glycomyces buryatensis]